MRYNEINTYQQSLLHNDLEKLISLHEFVVKKPVVARTSAWPSGAKNTSSTKRDPSLFEHLEAEGSKRRKCGIYKDPGHYRSKYSQNQQVITTNNPIAPSMEGKSKEKM
ncbi:hypothetical protein PsorP6_010792 [Peronosclerospora sorghi]|uniref:Uncharacterized protein n=1 Tax=Peronosclerospora sorghi TaxID=230839 RepID=A0ACC0VXR0_9STRA|nr:hypothetical protein PsorP6_010792 [Peronosclerospora sorghi]